MARLPIVRDGVVLLPEGAENQFLLIPVNSAAWFVWLAEAGTRSFAFHGSLGSCTVRREQQRRGKYWYAYHKKHGTLHKAYVGKTEDLTLERLTDVTNQLNQTATDAKETTPPVVTSDTPVSASSSVEEIKPSAVAANGSAPELIPASRLRFVLPLPPTPLLGREREVAVAYAMLLRQEVRWLTLTGPGGVGKTHLGLQVARRLSENFPDGVLFVDLSAVTDPDLVLPTIAQTLGLHDQAGQNRLDPLIAFCAQKHLLLLLDNFERSIQAAPQLLKVLDSCKHLKLLVTSRWSIRMRGAYEYVIPPLALPDLTKEVDPTTLAQSPSVALFVQRVQQVLPTFELTVETAPLVAAICVRLDGLPLALELAAARGKQLSLQAILTQLDQHMLSLLNHGARDLPLRQQTLRATLDWSYQFLLPQEQQLFNRLCIFANGCTLEAAMAIVGAPWQTFSAMLEGVTSLQEQSILLSSVSEDGTIRVRLLETIRTYGLEYLAASGEQELIREAHACYYLALAEEAERNLFRPQQGGTGWAQLALEYENLQVALRWWNERGNYEQVLRLASSLGPFWFFHGDLQTGLGWLFRFLRPGNSISLGVKARALNAAAALTGLQGDLGRAEQLCEQSLALYQELKKPRGILYALWIQASVAIIGNQYGLANRRARTALAFAQQGQEIWSVRLSSYLIAVAQAYQGEREEAREALEESLIFFHDLNEEFLLVEVMRYLVELIYVPIESGRIRLQAEALLNSTRLHAQTWNLARCLRVTGVLEMQAGDLKRARAFLEEGRYSYRRLRDLEGQATCCQFLAQIALDEQDLVTAEANIAEGWELALLAGDRWRQACCLEGWGELAVRQGQDAWAVCLWGAAQKIRTAVEAPMSPASQLRLTPLIAQVRARLDPALFETAWLAGQHVPLEQISGARKQWFARQLDASIPPALVHLTRREQQVLQLLGDGYSNQEIADRMVIAPVTVKSYLSTIYGKIGVSSRTEALRVALDLHLLQR